MRNVFYGLILIPLLAGCSVFGINSVEEADYSVLKSEDKFELRLYEPLVVAETYVGGDFDDAGGVAFSILFDYISGENTTSDDIAMTAPVIGNEAEADTSREIAMTVPVLEESEAKGWRYMFVLPSKYTIETAPKPLNKKVKLSRMPEKRVAVVRFSGLYDERFIGEKTTKLQKWMLANNLTPTSKPRWAGYNPPWTLPPLRRNEVMIDVN
jgi:hypothetical protein